MIVVNYYQEEDYNPETHRYHLTLAGVINDNLDLLSDIDLITECIENCGEFEPTNGVLYELYLDRATIAASFPLKEPAFVVNRIVEQKYSEDFGHYTPVVEL
jgi:hypothetical protein